MPSAVRAVGFPNVADSEPPHGDRGRRIRERRERLGMTITQLAEAVDVPRSRLSQVENGKGNPRGDTYGKIERGLDRLEERYGMNDPEVITHEGRPALVKYTIQGNFGVQAVVEGPVENIEELEASVARLIAGMQREQEGD